MNDHREGVLDVRQVMRTIEAELRMPSAHPARDSVAALERVRDLQRWYRREPVGGRLVALKRIVQWFSASTFDRQAKVVEALLDVVEDVARQARDAERRGRALQHYVDRFLGPSSGDDGAGRVVSARPGLASVLEEQSTIPPTVRLALYAWVAGRRPECSIAVGSRAVEESWIVTAALGDVGFGQLWCVAEEPRRQGHVEPGSRSHRVTALWGNERKGVESAAAAAVAPFQLAFVDGSSGREALVERIDAVTPSLCSGADVVVLVASVAGGDSAIDDLLSVRSSMLADCGRMAAEAVDGRGGADRFEPEWVGLQLLRRLS